VIYVRTCFCEKHVIFRTLRKIPYTVLHCDDCTTHTPDVHARTSWRGIVGIATTMQHTLEQLHSNQSKEHHYTQRHDDQVEHWG